MQHSILLLLATAIAQASVADTNSFLDLPEMPENTNRVLIIDGLADKIADGLKKIAADLTDVVSSAKSDLQLQKAKLGKAVTTALDLVYDDLSAQVTKLAEGANEAFAELAAASKITLVKLNAANKKITEVLTDPVKTKYNAAMTGYHQAQDAALAELAELVKETANDTKEAADGAKAVAKALSAAGEDLKKDLTASAKKLNTALEAAVAPVGSTTRRLTETAGDVVAGKIAGAVDIATKDTNTAVENFKKAKANAATTFTTLSLTAAVLLLAA